jgi:signal transduction histidine kinase
MTPEGTGKLRKRTAWFAIAWALAALVLSVYGQASSPRTVEPPIHTTSVGSSAVVASINEEARAAGIELGYRVLAVDGREIQDWYRERGWEGFTAGKPVRYRLLGEDDRIFEIVLFPRERRSVYEWLLIPIYAALAVVGVVFLMVGVFVWRLRPDKAEAWAFLLFSCAMATALFSTVNPYDAPLGYERMVTNLPLVGATMFHLFTTFPTEPSWVARRRRFRYAPYGLAGLVATLVAVEYLSGMRVPGLSVTSYAISTAFAVLAIGVLIHERYRMRGSGADTASADLVLTGTLVSFLPVALMTTAYVVFLPINWPYSIALVWFIAFPVTVGYGIVRGNLFDIRGAARSSAAYGAATLVITALFASLIAFADTAFGQFNVNASSPFFQGTFLFLAILAFNPLRNRLQTLVDRLFDRDRSGYRDAVREISEAMVSMLSLNEISERLLLAVTDTMGVERAMVLLMDDDERTLRPSAWRGDWDNDARDFVLPVDHPIGKHLWMRRQELSRSDFDEATDPETREKCWDVFDALDVRLLVPILFGVDLLGVIAVGAKLSSERLGPDDRQLLRTLANQSAIAIENAQAFDEIAKLNETLEARVDERTRELQDTQAQLMQSEKMRSLGQLVAGVAHELNNPIGFVHANLQLLDGYIEKLVVAQENGGDAAKPREAIRKLLARSREGTERVKGIVLNLRAFSRMDQAELSDANLNEELERTLGLMEPRLKGGIVLDRDFESLPPVRCYPAQLNQVFMNLVMNACDALEGKGTIRVSTRPGSEGVTLEIADDGPGIPSEVRERIFEPFFTTKPVGQGTGLGLSISHGIVERHGGNLSVECPPKGGTHFKIELPLVAKPPEGEEEASAA